MSHAPAAIVLAGGRSTRMGASKAALDWHGMPLVARIAGIVGREFAPGTGRREPRATACRPAPSGSRTAGPGAARWRGSLPGMRALDGRADAAFVTSTDAPFLHPAFLQGVAAALGDHDVAVPVADGREHPLAACWSLAALGGVEAALAADRLRVRSLLGRRSTSPADRRRERSSHPESLRNLNTPEDYRAALAEPLPLVTVRPGGGRTLRRAAALPVVELNGSPVRAGPRAAGRRRRRQPGG